MSENIAGYVDRAFVKGQFYAYDASPKPVVFTGNIDDIENSDLLRQAMFVTRGQSSGTLPNDFGNTFLIQTVQYGTNTYLQTAYLVQTGYDCYEYRRIYSGTWTDWVGVDSAIATVDSKIQEVKDTADNCYSAIYGTNGTTAGINAQISTINSNISMINNSTIPGVSNRVNALDSRLKTVETKTAGLGGTQLWSGTLTSGSINFNYGNYTSYLVIGKVRGEGARQSQLHVKGELTTSEVLYLISDEVEWIRYALKYSGTTATLRFDGRSATYAGGGAVLQVWGIN